MSEEENNAWKSASEPPPLSDKSDGYRHCSVDVLTCDKYGDQAVAFAWRYVDDDLGEPEGEMNWTRCDGEAWDITDYVTHWMPLPPSPYDHNL